MHGDAVYGRREVDMAGRIEPSRRHGPLDPRFRKPLKKSTTVDNDLAPDVVTLASELASWESEGGMDTARRATVQFAT
jgi:hypothetical protein